MKPIISYFSILVLLFTCFSCTNKKDDKQIETEYLNHYLKSMPIENAIRWVVILPGLGCEGCIQEAEAFMKEHISNKNIYFILSRIESLKILQNKIGIELKNQSNVYVDTESNLKIPTNNIIYPCIIQYEGGTVKKHEFQSPKNVKAFNNLKTRIQSDVVLH